MKEISQELRDRDCVICVNCGAIYEGAEGISGKDGICPECDTWSLYWITPEHSWKGCKVFGKTPRL